MRMNVWRIAASASVILLCLLAFSVCVLPGNVKFSAPHQGAMQALASRIALNPRVTARIVTKVLRRISIQSVYAQSQCGTTQCNGYAYYQTDCCFMWAGQCACQQLRCNYLGTNTYCQSLGTRSCYVTGYGNATCDNAQKKSCSP